jgi:hypothetical protein
MGGKEAQSQGGAGGPGQTLWPNPNEGPLGSLGPGSGTGPTFGFQQPQQPNQVVPASVWPDPTQSQIQQTFQQLGSRTGQFSPINFTPTGGGGGVPAKGGHNK